MLLIKKNEIKKIYTTRKRPCLAIAGLSGPRTVKFKFSCKVASLRARLPQSFSSKLFLALLVSSFKWNLLKGLVMGLDTHMARAPHIHILLMDRSSSFCI